MASAQVAAPQAKAGIRLGFDSYSLRALRWKAPRLIEYAAGLKLDSIQLSSLGDYATLDSAYPRKLEEQADRSESLIWVVTV